MKIIEIYNEDTMNKSLLVLNQIVRLRETEEKQTIISMSDGNHFKVNQPLKLILDLIERVENGFQQ